MRKAERGVYSIDQIEQILEQCDTVRLGLNGENGIPYVVPLSFGYERTGDTLVLYFHCAKTGRKCDLIARDGRVCVEADLLRGYCGHGTGITADYKSVIGLGVCRRVEDTEEKIKGLELLLAHCRSEGYSAKDCVLRDIADVYKITLTEVVGKQRFND